MASYENSVHSAYKSTKACSATLILWRDLFTTDENLISEPRLFAESKNLCYALDNCSTEFQFQIA